MFDRIEEYCGLDHLGKALPSPGKSASVRRLIFIDSEFLLPDAGLWTEDISREPAVAIQLATRFGRIPDNVAGTGNDVILFARDRQEADAVKAGDFIYRHLAKEA